MAVAFDSFPSDPDDHLVWSEARGSVGADDADGDVEELAVDQRSDDAVSREIVRVHGLEQAARHALMRNVAEYARREAYKADGAASMEEWCVEALSMERSRARELVRVSGVLEELVVLESAYLSGELSWDQLVPIASVASSDNEAELVEAARGLSAEQCRQLARRIRKVSKKEATAAHGSRSFKWFWDNQCMRFSGRLPDTDAAVVERALTVLAEAAPLGPDGEPEPFDVRCADALVQLASAQLDSEADGDRATVVIHTEDKALLDPTADVHLEAGPDLCHETLRRLCCDMRFQLVVEDGQGQVLGLGRTTRKVPPWLVRQLRRRDGGCRFPGCGRRRWVHAHHLVHWADGGETNQDNLVLLCSRHHRVLHEQGWTTSGTVDELHLHAPSGRILTSHPIPRRLPLKE
ncbi:MAG: HNH endonuclease [Acidimicrobiales bacterium]